MEEQSLAELTRRLIAVNFKIEETERVRQAGIELEPGLLSGLIKEREELNRRIAELKRAGKD